MCSDFNEDQAQTLGTFRVTFFKVVSRIMPGPPLLYCAGGHPSMHLACQEDVELVSQKEATDTKMTLSL
jgi:hypothetical protein